MRYVGQSLDKLYRHLKGHYDETAALVAAGVIPLGEGMQQLRQINNEIAVVMARRIALSKRLATK